MVTAFSRLLEKHGAVIKTNASVERIETLGSSVKKCLWTRDGDCYDADLIVSNADPVRVYRDMLPPDLRRKHSNSSLKRKTHSMSLFVAYFGAKKQYTDLAHHTILLGPRYQGLLNDIFERKVLADDFSLYLHAPTRTDPNMAPDGHETFYVLSPVPNNQSGINWGQEANRYKDKIYKFLEERALPGLMDNLTVDFHVDPNYFENDLQSEHGAAFGIEPSFKQSAYFRFHNRSEDLENLFFVGANTHPGAGVPGVLCSAKVLEKVIPDSRSLS